MPEPSASRLGQPFGLGGHKQMVLSGGKRLVPRWQSMGPAHCQADVRAIDGVGVPTEVI